MNVPEVLSITAKCVYEGEKFTYKRTLTETILEHEPDPDLDGDFSKLRLAYAIAEMENGQNVEYVMGQKRILLARDHSAGYRNDKQYGRTNLMWETFEDTAWMKTVVRALTKLIPKTEVVVSLLSLEQCRSN